MKPGILILVAIIIVGSFYSCDSLSGGSYHKKIIRIDHNGKSYKNWEDFKAAPHPPNLAWTFDTKNDTACVIERKYPTYEYVQVDYLKVKAYMENITRQKFADSTFFIIAYRYFDDPCKLDVDPNRVTHEDITKRKVYTDKLKSAYEAQEAPIAYFCMYESGIKLESSTGVNDYYINDIDNLIRNEFLIHPAVCGSGIYVKPDGKVMLLHGEGPSWKKADELRPAGWAPFFNTSAETNATH